jgi:uncharacterized protein YgiM (DUF1202 family)
MNADTRPTFAPRSVALALFVLLLVLATGCNKATPAAVPISPTAASVPAAQVPPTAEPSTSVPPSATPVPLTATPVPPTATAVPPTNTPVPPTNTPVPPTNTPAPPTSTPTSKGLQATVKGASMNVRAGPGAAFQVVATAKSGETFDVTGRNLDSSWLQVCCFAGKKGWVSAEQ